MKKLSLSVYFILCLGNVVPAQSPYVAIASGYDEFPALYKRLSENMDDPKCREEVTGRFLQVDGYNWASEGEQEALDLTRKVVAMEPVPYSAAMYLALKGNESDIELLDQVSRIHSVLSHMPHPIDVLRGRMELNVDIRNGLPFGFIPSIANTGPQAIYVQAILEKVWRQEWETTHEKLVDMERRSRQKDTELLNEFDEQRETAIYGASTPEEERSDVAEKFAIKRKEMDQRRSEEWEKKRKESFAIQKRLDALTAIVVSFDANGNPVSSVDLSEYGISMPVITPKPDRYYRGEYTIVFPHETENTNTLPTNATETIKQSPSGPTLPPSSLRAERSNPVFGSILVSAYSPLSGA